MIRYSNLLHSSRSCSFHFSKNFCQTQYFRRFCALGGRSYAFRNDEKKGALKHRRQTTNIPSSIARLPDFINDLNSCTSISAIFDLQRLRKVSMRPKDVSHCWKRALNILSNSERERQHIKRNYGLLEPLIQHAVEVMHEMDNKSLVFTAKSIAKISSQYRINVDARLWLALEKSVLQITSIDAQEISTLMRTVTKAGKPLPSLMNHLANATISKLNLQSTEKVSVPAHTFSPGNLSNMLWTYAKLRHASPDLFEVASKVVIKDIDNFIESQHLPITLWAYATLRHESTEMFEIASQKLIPKMGSLSPQGISNILWSYAKFRHLSPNLFESASQAIMNKLDTFITQDLTNIMWSYATMDHPDPKLFDALAKESSTNIHKFNPQQLSITLWAYAKMRHAAPELFRDIGDSAMPRLHKFKPQGLSLLLWSHAKMKYASPALFDAASYAIIKKINEFPSQNLANTLWAYATVRHDSPALFDTASNVCAKKISNFKPQEIANTVWAYASIGHASPNLFEAASCEAIKRMNKFIPQDISNVLWSYATIGHTSPELFRISLEEASEKVDRFRAIELANTIWACAKTNHASSEFLDAASYQTIKKLSTFKPQEISMTVWAFATLRHSSPALFDATSSETIKKLPTFNSQNISNTVWAYATIGHASPGLFDAASDEAIKMLPTFGPRNMSITLWSYATLRHSSPALFDAASEEIIPKLPTFNPQDIFNTIWAFTTLQHSSPALFDAASEEAVKKMSLFKTHEIAKLLQCYAKINYYDCRELVRAVVHHVVTMKLDKCNAEDTLNILWSLAVTHSSNLDSAELLLRHAARLLLADEGCLTITNLSKLHQALIWYSMEHGKKSEACKDLYDKCFSVFSSLPKEPSKFQQDVVSTLLSIGVELQQEVVCDHTGYSIDAIIMTKEGHELAVEVDGPHHYIDRHIPTGPTILKHRHLQLSKRPLLAIPYWEWYDLHTDVKGKQEYLERSIARVLSDTNESSE